jgi:hypothetical protein
MQVPNLHISTFLSDHPKYEPVHATWKCSTPPPYAVPDDIVGWVHATPIISHSQCMVVFSRNGIAKVFGLLGYVVTTTKSRLTQVHNGWSSIDIDGTSTTRQPCRLNHQKHIHVPSGLHFHLFLYSTFKTFHEWRTFVNDKLITQLLSAKHG